MSKKQQQFDRGTTLVAPSRYVATIDFWQSLRGHDFDPESFVPLDPKQHALAHAIKADTEFATDDKHGPMHGPIVDYLMKHSAVNVRTAELGDVYLALRVQVPARNLTVWVYPPESEDTLRRYHSAEAPPQN